MKALLTAFALLSFVAASTLPMVASAEGTSGGTQTSTMHHKAHKKMSHKKPTHHKHMTKKPTHHKNAMKKPHPKTMKPKEG
jgi:Ni/Co efflux regulator RcnB